MALSIVITNSPTIMFSSDLRAFRVVGVPTDTTPVTVSLSDGSTTVYSAILYSVNGVIGVSGIDEVLSYYLEPLQKKSFALTIKAGHQSSQDIEQEWVQVTLTIIYSRLCLDPSYTLNFCTHYITHNYLTLVPDRIVDRATTYYLPIWSNSSHTASVSFRLLYDDDTTAVITDTKAMLAGVELLDVNVASLQTDKKIKAVTIGCEGRSATFFVTDNHTTALTYSNLFKCSDTLHVNAVINRRFERESEDATVDGKLVLYDVRPAAYVDMTINIANRPMALALQDMIASGYVTMEGVRYIITSHEWTQNGTPGEMPYSVSMTLRPEATAYQMPTVAHIGTFSDTYNEIYD